MTLFKTGPIPLGLTAFFLGIATSQPVMAASFTTKTIDFENIPGNPKEGDLINNQFDGITFSLVGGGSPILAEVDGPTAIAFTVDRGTKKDRPKGTQNGSFFITDPKNDQQESLRVDYDKPVSTASGDILDIDENQNGKKEAWMVTALDSSDNPLDSIVIWAGDPDTGHGKAT